MSNRRIIFWKGFQGEVIVKNVEQSEVVYSGRITNNDNGITNSLDMVQNINGGWLLTFFFSSCFWLFLFVFFAAHQLIVSSNDDAVRLFDLPSMNLVSRFSFDWAVNVSLSVLDALFAFPSWPSLFYQISTHNWVQTGGSYVLLAIVWTAWSLTLLVAKVWEREKRKRQRKLSGSKKNFFFL